jgi:spermidine synthase
VKALHAWVLAAAALCALHAQATYRLFALYVAPAGAAWLGILGIFGGALTGVAVAGWSRRFAGRIVAWQLIALALSGVAGSFAPFFAFPLGSWAARAAAVCVGANVALLTGFAIASTGTFGRSALSLGFVPFVLGPARAAATLAVLLLAEIASSRVGHLRSGPAIALLTTVLAVFHPGTYAALYDRPPWAARGVLPAAVAVAGLSVAALFAAERLLPSRELGRFPDEIVFAQSTAVSDYAVVASPSGYELFRDGQLAISSLDEARRANALIAPALAATKAPRRVLLLDGGFGVAERRILDDPRVEQLTVVCPDAAQPALARRLAFVSEQVQGALDSPRVRTVMAEPLAWLAGHDGDLYDVVVADFPWPLGYREGKLYTRYAFAKMANHLTAGGFAVVPGASAFTAKEALADVITTLASIGLSTAPYHVPIPTVGVASFVVASRLPVNTTQLVAAVPGADQGADLTPTLAGQIATLHTQSVVTAFERARDR